MVLITGLPGSGKSTMAEVAGRALGAPVLGHDWAMSGLRPFAEVQDALDAMGTRGHRGVGWSVLWALARSQLRLGSSVVLDGVARDPEVDGTRGAGGRGGRGVSRRHDHVPRRRAAPGRGSRAGSGTSRTGTSWTGITSSGRGRRGFPPTGLDLVLDAGTPVEENAERLRTLLAARS